MVELCRARSVQLLCYGTLCGGLLSERFLGQPEPGWSVLDTASLQKYKQMIDAWGGWLLFQDLLAVLKRVADKHGASIANVGVRSILDRPAVAGVIVGVRLGLADHLEDNLRVFDVHPDQDDREQIQRCCRGRVTCIESSAIAATNTAADFPLVGYDQAADGPQRLTRRENDLRDPDLQHQAGQGR